MVRAGRRLDEVDAASEAFARNPADIQSVPRATGSSVDGRQIENQVLASSSDSVAAARKRDRVIEGNAARRPAVRPTVSEVRRANHGMGAAMFGEQL